MCRYYVASVLTAVCLLVSSCASLFKGGGDLYPVITPDGSVFGTQVKVYLAFPEKDVEIRYTTDGSEPGPDSSIYGGPITLKDSALVKVTAYRGTESVGNTVRAKFTRQEPSAKPLRTILFVIDTMNRQMFDKLPLETYNSLISKGVLYKNMAGIPPISLPVSKEYYWNQLTSIPPLVSGTALIGTPGLNRHLIQNCFTETTALCSSSSSLFPSPDKPLGKGIAEGYTLTHDLESELGAEDFELKSDSIIADLKKLIESDNPSFITVYSRGPARAAAKDSKAGRLIWSKDSEWYKSIMNSDRRLGELVSWLDKKGYMKDTVLMVAGTYGVNDDGASPTYDSKTAFSSLIISGKGVKKNKVFGYAETIDVMPTICWLNGKESSEFCQGKVLAEAFEGQDIKIRSDHWMSRLGEILCAHKELLDSPKGKEVMAKVPAFSELNSRFQLLNRIGNWQNNSATLAELVYKNEILYKKMSDTVKSYSSPAKKTKKRKGIL